MSGDFLADDKVKSKWVPFEDGFTWDDLPQEIREGIEAPPRREDYGNGEDFREESVGWARYALPKIHLRIDRFSRARAKPPELKF